jgi:hypothetical protein
LYLWNQPLRKLMSGLLEFKPALVGAEGRLEGRGGFKVTMYEWGTTPSKPQRFLIFLIGLRPVLLVVLLGPGAAIGRVSGECAGGGGGAGGGIGAEAGEGGCGDGGGIGVGVGFKWTPLLLPELAGPGFKWTPLLLSELASPGIWTGTSPAGPSASTLAAMKSSGTIEARSVASFIVWI